MNSGAVSAVVAVVGLALTIVALFATWRVSKGNVSTQVYRDTALAWQSKSEALTSEVADLRNALAGRDQKLAALEGKVETMKDMITGARNWVTIEQRTQQLLVLSRQVLTEVRRPGSGSGWEDGEP